MTHFEMIRTESIKRTDHLFTFLFSKTYLDKLIRIDNRYYCQDKPLSHHWQHVILSRCIQLTLLHTILVSILYILLRLTQLGLYKSFSMSLIRLSLYFRQRQKSIISPSLVLLHWCCEALSVIPTRLELVTPTLKVLCSTNWAIGSIKNQSQATYISANLSSFQIIAMYIAFVLYDFTVSVFNSEDKCCSLRNVLPLDWLISAPGETRTRTPTAGDQDLNLTRLPFRHQSVIKVT